MNIFGWLVLGHFLADWLFQSDWMAMGKRRHIISFPGIVHYALYTAIILLVLYFFGNQIDTISLAIAVGTIIFLSHWIIDGTNLIHTWMQLFRQREQVMVYVVIDQTLHLMILGIIAACLS